MREDDSFFLLRYIDISEEKQAVKAEAHQKYTLQSNNL